MGLGVDRLTIPCPNGDRKVLWGNSGGGPGFNSYALIADDTSRQLVVAMNVYDIAEEVEDRSPIPPEVDLAPAVQGVFC